MHIVLGLVGLCLGAAIGGFGGAAFFCLAGVLLGVWIKRDDKTKRLGDASDSQSVSQRAAASEGLQDFESLRAEVLELRRRVARLESGARAAPIVPPAPVSGAAPARAPEQVRVPEVVRAPEPEPDPVPVLTAKGEILGAPRAAAEPAAEPPAEPNPIWTWLTGGNAMVRVGVVVLFFGVAFLMKYAAEHVHVPIEARLTGVALGAIVMLILGWRWRERAGGYGLVLQGGGVGVLYLVVFGAFRIWTLVPGELAFALLVAIAFASAVLAVAQDSRALAIAGVSGGFLAPVLASTGQGSHVMLFGFYLVLNLGVLAVAWYKAWRELNIVGFAFTFVIGAMWGNSYYRPEHYATTQPFLIAFFLLYVAIAVLYALRRAPRLTDYVDSVLVFGVPLVAAGLQFGMVKEIEYGAAWSALALGAFYVLAAQLLWKQQRESLQLLVECFIALGVGFSTLAIPLAFDGRWTAASWALEGAAALWVGVRQKRALPRYFGLLLQPAAGIAFLASKPAVAGGLAVLNSGFMGGATVALSGLFCAWYLERRREPDDKVSPALAALLLAWGAAWWVGTGWHELSQFVTDRELVRGLQLLLAAASALGFAWAREKLEWPKAAYAALALLPVMLLYAVLWPDRHAHPFAGLGYAGWPVAFIVLYWVLARLERDVSGKLGAAVHCVGLWLLAALAGWECSWQLDKFVGEGRIWSQIGRPLIPVLLAAWIATRAQGGHWPFNAHLRLYVAHGAAPLMAALWLWVLYINFASNGNPAPLPYLPLLNPLDLMVALIGVVYLLWRKALAQHQAPEPLVPVLQAAPAWLGATGFIWANGVLLRSLHHWADVPFRLEAMLRSTLVQAAFSVFWSLLALGAMVFANRRGMRAVWTCGAVLLGVVVVKLFVIDLQRISGMERIVSFLGVGVLLLVIGYFAPVPTRKEEKLQ
jgi:uncharacterized membrane protein